ncbi:MAG: hypothetical protein U0359_17055 [Byssovorax sp.]
MSTLRHLGASALAILLVAGLAFAAPSCATEEPVTFADAGQTPNGEPSVTSGSTSSSSSSTSGGGCVVNMACSVSFKNDIFPNIIEGSGGCTKNGCHTTGTANGNMELNPGDAAGAYSELLNYTLMPKSGTGGGPYVTPCDAQSRLLCNLAVEDSTDVPCGTAMPIGAKITKAQYDQIAEWIACGAPDN